jgi:hypothetical protein
MILGNGYLVQQPQLTGASTAAPVRAPEVVPVRPISPVRASTQSDSSKSDNSTGSGSSQRYGQTPRRGSLVDLLV